jgi:predicted ATPase/DNA-binding XRE family transcriptional regulator
MPLPREWAETLNMARQGPSSPFGQLLRRFRLAAGLSQEELAERAGLSVRGISDLERGQRSSPFPETVRRLADGLGLNDAERAELTVAARPELAGSAPPAKAVAPATRGTGAPATPPTTPSPPHPRRLPVPPTRLVGREGEVANLVALLRRPDVRLVTLIGPGGVGKTRLALAVAEELAADFSDGAVWVEVAAAREPALVIAAVAHALGIRESGGTPLAAALGTTLAGRDLLLVLDNFEQVLPAAIEVAGWLAAAPALKILVTSRERLHLRGEREIPIAPLALPASPPAGASKPPLEGLAGVPAVRLFVERAEEARHGFVLSTENAGAIAEIVRRLDGLPLAIELAAARVRMFSAPELLDRLGQRLPVLTEGALDLPARQRTLDAAIAWSHDLLRVEEQALFRRLSVFAGGFTLESAEAVGGAADAFALLASLVDKSLVRQVEGRDGRVRFAPLETVREFAAQRLLASGEAVVVGKAHAAHFLTLAEAAGSRLKGEEQVAWLTRLETEHDNFRAALAWTIDHDAGLGLRLAANLAQFWFVHSHLSEGRTWLERALALAAGSVNERVNALYGLAILARAQADYGRAATLADEAIALCRSGEDQGGLARALYVRGTVAQAQGEHVDAATLLEEGLALARELDQPARVASFLNVLSDVADAQGDRPRAFALIEEALALKRRIGDVSGIATCLNNLGVLALNQRQFARADSLFGEALEAYRELGDRAGIAMSLNNLGTVKRDLGDIRGALPLMTEALTLFAAVGDRSGVAYGLENLVAIAVAATRYQAAARLLGAADSLREAIGEPLPVDQRAQHKELTERIRAAIGDEASAAARERGRALSPEAAIAEGISLTIPAAVPAR